MDKLKAWWAAHRPTRRRLIQVYAALLYNAHLKGFIEGEIYTGPLKNVCVPGFNCYSCPGAIGACPLGALQNALASSGNRAPYYVLGILLLFGLTLGRMICGWLCPLGLIQELLHKLPTPKLPKSRFTRALSWLKYVILAIFVIIIPLHYSAQLLPVPAFCKYICPAGTFEGAIGLLSNPVNAPKFSLLGILFTRKFIILILIAQASVFVYRAFCRFICPLGAIYGLFSRLSLLGVKVSPSQCTHCGRCVAQCPMDIKRVGDHECIHCGACVAVCPEKAISWKGAKGLSRGGEAQAAAGRAHGKPGRARWVVAWVAALALLGGVLVMVNRPPQPQTAPVAAVTPAPAPTESGAAAGVSTAAPLASEAPVGNEVGMTAPDFTVPLYGAAGGDFTLSKARGKVVIVNFWATWCTPCCAELPYFQRVYEAHPEDVAMVAIHSNMVTDDVQAYLDKQSYTLPFALDADGSVIRAFGGSTAYPMTVVLDQAGQIVYNQEGSVTYELLESLIAQAKDGE